MINTNNYHETLWSVFDNVKDALVEKSIVSSEFDNFTHTGGIGYGESQRLIFEVDSIKGKNTRKGLTLSIFRMDSGRYELTAYVA